MITYENTKTLYDLVQNAGKEHGDRVFIRYEENDVIHDVTYRQFVDECNAIAAWTKEQDAIIGHKVQVGLMGGSSHHYLAVMLGVMSNGNTVVPLDIQLNIDNFPTVSTVPMWTFSFTTGASSPCRRYQAALSPDQILHISSARQACPLFRQYFKRICRPYRYTSCF